MNEAIRWRHVRSLALAVAALAFLVVVVSAWLRLDAAGLGCANWPQCYGQNLAGGGGDSAYGWLRLTHRVVASAALILALLLAWRCWRPAVLPGVSASANGVLGVMLALAALGPLSADPARAWVGWLNIVGGMLLFALAWRTVLATRSPPAMEVPRGKPPRLLRAGAALLGITIALGAWIGASYSARACPEVLRCAADPALAQSASFQLPPTIHLQQALPPGAPDGVLLHRLHRLGGVLTLLMLGVAAVTALRQSHLRKSALAVGILLVATFALGLSSLALDLPLAVTVGHGAAAALLLAALSTLRLAYRNSC